MSSKRISRRMAECRRPALRPPKASSKRRPMTDDEIMAAALSDPDCPPSTPEQLAQFRRAVNVKAIREKLGLTQEGFARRFNLDVRAVQDWEQDRRRPDRAARSLLRVIEANPKAVERALRKVG